MNDSRGIGHTFNQRTGVFGRYFANGNRQKQISDNHVKLAHALNNMTLILTT